MALVRPSCSDKDSRGCYADKAAGGLVNTKGSFRPSADLRSSFGEWRLGAHSGRTSFLQNWLIWAVCRHFCIQPRPSAMDQLVRASLSQLIINPCHLETPFRHDHSYKVLDTPRRIAQATPPDGDLVRDEAAEGADVRQRLVSVKYQIFRSRPCSNHCTQFRPPRPK